VKNNSQDIQEELAGLDNPFEHRPDMPFEVPAGYFEKAKSEMMENILAIDFVEKLPKAMPQSVPQAYFEQSKDEIFSTIGQETEKVILSSVRSNGRRSWALAAAMALLISVGIFFLNTNSKMVSLENELSSIPTQQIQGYIDANAYDFEAHEILENPEITSKEIQDLEEKILNETKSMSDEELFTYVL
jgi:hypothetical protein